MKDKAMALDAEARRASPETDEDGMGSDSEAKDVPSNSHGDPNHGPKYNAIVAALQALKPTSLTLVDNSHQHAGHAGNDIDGESHFELEIVAEAFDGLNLVKRHKLVYMMLGEIMPQIHALQISAKTPDETS